MWILWAILGILAFLLLLTAFPLVLSVRYEQEPYVFLRYLFFKFHVAPVSEEAKENGEDSEKESKKKLKKQGKVWFSFFRSLWKEKGLSGLFFLLKEAVSLFTGTLKKLAPHIRVSRLLLQVQVGEANAAETALAYGKACSIVYPSVGALAGMTKCKKYAVEVSPDFESGSTVIQGELKASVPVFFLLTVGISAILRGILLLKKEGVLDLLQKRKSAHTDTTHEKGQSAGNKKEN